MDRFGIVGREKIIHSFFNAFGELQGKLQAMTRVALVPPFTINDDGSATSHRAKLTFGFQDYELVANDFSDNTLAVAVACDADLIESASHG